MVCVGEDFMGMGRSPEFSVFSAYTSDPDNFVYKLWCSGAMQCDAKIDRVLDR